jgi:hypothetical protein
MRDSIPASVFFVNIFKHLNEPIHAFTRLPRSRVYAPAYERHISDSLFAPCRIFPT